MQYAGELHIEDRIYEETSLREAQKRQALFYIVR